MITADNYYFFSFLIYTVVTFVGAIISLFIFVFYWRTVADFYCDIAKTTSEEIKSRYDEIFNVCGQDLIGDERDE